jgi:hypothetical protein
MGKIFTSFCSTQIRSNSFFIYTYVTTKVTFENIHSVKLFRFSRNLDPKPKPKSKKPERNFGFRNRNRNFGASLVQNQSFVIRIRAWSRVKGTRCKPIPNDAKSIKPTTSGLNFKSSNPFIFLRESYIPTYTMY